MSVVETEEYLRMVARMLRAAGRRVAEGDEPDLSDLIGLQRALDDAIAAAVAGQRERGASWQRIADGTGKTRQAAFQRWGARVAS